jgi:hypothetical protein
MGGGQCICLNNTVGLQSCGLHKYQFRRSEASDTLVPEVLKLRTERGVTQYLLDMLRYDYKSAAAKAVCHLQVEQGAACLGYLELRVLCANSRHTRVATKKG